jgi:hypothetical protein
MYIQKKNTNKPQNFYSNKRNQQTNKLYPKNHKISIEKTNDYNLLNIREIMHIAIV